MRPFLAGFLIALSLIWGTAAGIAGNQEASAVQGQFDRLVDEYFNYSFSVNPSWATDIGVHDYDRRLENFSRQAIQEEIARDKEFVKRLEAIDPGQLSRVSVLDRELLKAHILGEILEREDIQSWRRNPDIYSSGASASIFSLIKRNFAPLPDRLKLVIAREKQIPGQLSEARQNITHPPAIYTQIALEQLPGIIDFFQKSVPEAFKTVNDRQLQDQFAAVNRQVVESLRSYQQFLKEDVQKRSDGNFALGPELYRKKLLYDEMVDTPLDALLADGYRELHRLQKLFVETAQRIDPDKPASEVYLSISEDHPKPAELLQSVRNVLDEIANFCRDREIVTIPSSKNVLVQETPPFMRALTFASMDTPGPFEKKATEAYYQVTLPEAGWTSRQIEEHMRQFCRMDLINTSVHEAYPGHYVQFLWDRSAPSKVRKLVGCGSNAEGWAHYCEEMMLDQGFRGGDRRLRMVQIHDALLRACRYIVGIEMHTGGWSLDDGIRFFMKEGYQERVNAEREAKRGTSDPTYLVYTLGKMEILKLRDDYRKLKGDNFNLREFHDQFLAQGFPPLKIVRAALLSTEPGSSNQHMLPVSHVEQMSGPISGKKPNWLHALPDGLSQARSRNKLVLVDLYTGWCGWCKKLDRETYPDPKVLSLLKQKFVCVKLDAEDGAGGESFARQYNVRGYPCIIILDPDGKMLETSYGYKSVEEFSRLLDKYVNPDRSS